MGARVFGALESAHAVSTGRAWHPPRRCTRQSGCVVGDLPGRSTHAVIAGPGTLHSPIIILIIIITIVTILIATVVGIIIIAVLIIALYPPPSTPIRGHKQLNIALGCTRLQSVFPSPHLTSRIRASANKNSRFASYVRH